MVMKAFRRPVIISGATGVGKSEISLALAREFKVGIFAADSMQVYRGLDIASAKPSCEDRALVPHAGIDLVEITESFSVAQWLSLAEKFFPPVDGNSCLGTRWLMVGGTGLYVRSFIRGLDDLPPTPLELRAKWESVSLQEAAEELRRRAPEVAARVDLANPRRVVRALALLELGAAPHRRSWQKVQRNVLHIHLVRERESLRQRIWQRTRAMFESGIVEEFRRLKACGLRPGHTAWQAIGMNVLEELVQGKLKRDEAIERMAVHTWQYSRRQRIWFSKEPVDLCVNLDAPDAGSVIRRAIEQEEQNAS